MRRVLKRLLGFAGGGAMLLLVVIWTPLAWYFGAPLREPGRPRPSDVIVVFASGQIDPQWLTPDSAQRLLGGLQLWRDHFGSVIITSGSQHELGYDQAEQLGAWLVRAGVPPDAVVIENRSTRTYESVIELQRLMQERHWQSAVIVTSLMDVPRLRLVCDHLGVNASFLAVPGERPPRPGHLLYAADGYAVFYHALYEYAGLLYYRLRGWI